MKIKLNHDAFTDKGAVKWGMSFTYYYPDASMDRAMSLWKSDPTANWTPELVAKRELWLATHPAQIEYICALIKDFQTRKHYQFTAFADDGDRLTQGCYYAHDFDEAEEYLLHFQTACQCNCNEIPAKIHVIEMSGSDWEERVYASAEDGFNFFKRLHGEDAHVEF